MDLTEAGLELLVKKLRNNIESSIESLVPSEISLASGEIPTFKSMLEYREIRDKFLGKFNDPCPIPQASSYAEHLLSRATEDCDLTDATEDSLRIFFNSEIERIARIREVTLNRCTLPDIFTKIQMPFAAFSDSLTKHSLACEEGLQRLNSKELATVSAADMLSELNMNFYQKRRRALLSAILRRIRRFPLTKHEEIYSKMFEETLQSMKEDQRGLTVPIMLRTEKDVDAELIRLANRFCLKPDLQSNDGQKFLYHSHKTFDTVFRELNFFGLPQRDVELGDLESSKTLTDLTQQLMTENIPKDIKLEKMFKELVSKPIEDVATSILDDATNYNALVGNVARSRTFALAGNQRAQLPSHKIISWMELRFVNMKFLACAVMTNVNYFEYIRSKLKTGKSNVMKSTGVRCRHSKKFREILETYDENGTFIFQSAIESYNKIIDQLIGVGSYYIDKFEERASERSQGQSVVVDRSVIIERLLENELRYLNAKRQLLQPLIEVLEHVQSKELLMCIYNVIAERPNYNLPTYKSFEAPYKLAIRLMTKKAELIRSIVNLQIVHERRVSSTLGENVPLFDRPSLIPCDDISSKLFEESISLSPFEIYESLSKVASFLCIVPKVGEELAEAADIKFVRYGSYLELAVWNEVDNVLKTIFDQGFFPFDRAALNFDRTVSDPVVSLFVSPYVNTIESIREMISGLNESRQLRFMMSTRRFMHLTWKLQTLMIETSLFQKSYDHQCNEIGLTDKTVLMSSFKDSATRDIIDHHSSKTGEDILDFALTEFEKVTIDFRDESMIKDIIFAADFQVLKRLIRFQNLQNTILEIAIRFNRSLLDSNFLCNYFELGSDTGMFLTGVDLPDDDDGMNQFFKQYMAMKIFYESTTIYRDNQLALQDKSQFYMSIREIKSKSRTILSAHAKQKSMEDGEMLEFYLSEMVDAFSPFAYRIELARICSLERHILLSNSFVDTYALGPDPTTCLINSAGRFEKFFYVPTWVEVFLMIRGAPHARQGMVLKSALQFVQSRFRVLNLVRHECSLSQRLNVVFEAIYNQNFQLETPIFQKLFTEFTKLPNADEVEIATKYITEKEKYLFHRFEYSVLIAYQSFLVSLSGDDKKKIADPKFGENMKRLWLLMHEPLVRNKGLIIEDHYIPLWEKQFVHNCHEFDRGELVTRIASTDSFIEEALTSIHNPSIMAEDPIASLPIIIDFLCLSISQLHIKHAYFLLLAGKEDHEIDIRSSISDMTTEIYTKGSPQWDDTIIKQANQHLVPKEEAPSRVTETIPEPKLAQAIFDVVRSQVDLILLSSQIQKIQKSIDSFGAAMNLVPDAALTISQDKFGAMQSSEVMEVITASIGKDFPVLEDTRPSLLEPAQSTIQDLRNLKPYVVNTSQLLDQFKAEAAHSQQKFILLLSDALRSCVITKEDEDGSTLYDADGFLEQCSKMSFTVNKFTEETLKKMTETWKAYLANIGHLLNNNDEAMGVVSIVSRLASERFDCQTDSEVGTMFHSTFIELNDLRQRLHALEQVKDQNDESMERDLRRHYENLIEDLKLSTIETKKEAGGIKRKVYDDVLQKINKAKSFALRLRTPGEISREVMKEYGTKLDDDFLSGIRRENDAMRKEIALLRVFRCISEKAVSRHYTKRIDQMEKERKEANTALWTNKLQCESDEESMEKKLYDTHQQLSTIQLEIDHLKAQLENEKMSNIQLVHWKAKHLKTIDGLKKEIASYEGVGDVNIDKLVTRLMNAQAELDELRGISEELEIEADEQVRKPMRIAESIRRENKKARASSTLMRECGSGFVFNGSKANKEAIVQTLSDQNIQLRHNNEVLQQKIEELEAQKQAKSMHMKQLMEETLCQKAPSLRARTRMAGRIFKPTVSQPRSVSRI